MSAAGVETFFRSRWVDRPEHVSELEPVGLPGGFRAAGVAAGLKPEGLDVGVVVCDDERATSAARFTTNARVGAPVTVSRRAELAALRAVAANSGGSNTGDGQRGIDTALAMQGEAATQLGLRKTQVAVASTGVIGDELPRDKVVAGVKQACAQLGSDSATFSEAILTSDNGTKRACLEVELAGGMVRLSAQAKGAGMISPRFATMFCFVQTDALIDPDTLDLLTGVCVKRSFDRISVDGQLSTSDTVVAIAGGESGVEVPARSGEEKLFGEALDSLLRQLAIEIVADGEGSRRIGRVVVRGAAEAVEPVARAVADSPLVKTALHGADPNFGRVLQAAGAAWQLGGEFRPDLSIEGVQVVEGGEAIELSEQTKNDLEQAVNTSEVEYQLGLPGSGGETEVFFSDLSPEYVHYNAEYTS